ncbi:MAG: DUF1223 domain-containing protein [Verrucomicrobiota bacterium]
MKHLFILAGIFMATTVARAADVVTFQSGPQRVTMIELFSSEGCSSCPPADDWLNALENKDGLWTKFVPIAWHVDYWDRLGWRDPWAQAAFTKRQYRYSSAWKSQSVYTPGFVLNGGEWRGWSSGKIPATKENGGELRVVVTNAHDVAATFVPDRTMKTPLEIHIALLGVGLSSKVRAGENEGRNLKHSFVVVSHTHAPLISDGKAISARLTLPKINSNAPRLAIAAWVERADTPGPWQAAGGWIK